MVANSGPSPSTAHGVYNATPPTVADGQAVPLQVDVNGNVKTVAASGGSTAAVNLTQAGGVTLEATSTTAGGVPVYILDPATGLRAAIATVVQVNTEGQKATYAANIIALASVASATDIFTITGSATKTVKILRFGVSGIATAAASFVAQLIKRSTANTSGTSSAPAAVPHDSTSGAATATVLAYTGNPTLGSTVGAVRSAYIGLTGTSGVTGGAIQEWLFSTANDQAVTLRGVAQVLALNLNGVTVTGGAFNVWVEWTEE